MLLESLTFSLRNNDKIDYVEIHLVHGIPDHWGITRNKYRLVDIWRTQSDTWQWSVPPGSDLQSEDIAILIDLIEEHWGLQTEEGFERLRRLQVHLPNY